MANKPADPLGDELTKGSDFDPRSPGGTPGAKYGDKQTPSEGQIDQENPSGLKPGVNQDPSTGRITSTNNP